VAVAAITDQPPVNVPPEAPKTPGNCDAVDAYNWNTDIARAICMAESGGNPEATGYNSNGTADRGLMQVNSIHADLVGGNVTALYDPATNIKIAYSLSHEGTNWTAWSAYNNGSYRKFL
jgi:soluble lytic murein transglycosylase-like protein